THPGRLRVAEFAANRQTLRAALTIRVRSESYFEMAQVHPDIYFFGGGAAEGRAKMCDLLGGKGANLAEMASLKLPVPPGFTISTRVCNYFYDHGHKYPKGLNAGVAK